MSQKIKNILLQVLPVTIIAAFLVVVVIYAWTEPNQAPPVCPAGQPGCDAPINVSVSPQIKSGALQVNGFRNIGTTVLNGNVGIGTIGPEAKLHIQQGDLLFKADASDPGDIIFRNSAGTQKARIWSEPADVSKLHLSSGDNAPDITIDTAGNVGIGTAAPGAKLDIQGGTIKLKGIVIDHVTGLNPSCPGGSGVMLMRKWSAKNCSMVSNDPACVPTSCTTPVGWSISSPTCTYYSNCPSGWGSCGSVCTAYTCTAGSWTEVICMGN